MIPNLRRRYEEGSWVEQESLEPYRALRPCPSCQGARLKPQSRAVRVKGRTVTEYVNLPIAEALKVFESFELTDRETLIASRILREIRDRLRFLNDVGVGYLTLNRSAATLSGGEGQRIRLATQIGANLTGVLYVLDDDDRVAQIAQARERREQRTVVALVQPDRRLVEDVEHADELRADLRREPQPLRLAARQRRGRLAQAKIPEPHVLQDAQASREQIEEHTSELQSPIDISYAVFCLKKKRTRLNSSHQSTSRMPSSA